MSAQAMTALGRANQTRSERARLKRHIAGLDRCEAFAYVAEILTTEPPPEIERMAIAELLTSIPRFGHTSVNRILRNMTYRAKPLLSDFTDRQKRQLAELLRCEHPSSVDALGFLR